MPPKNRKGVVVSMLTAMSGVGYTYQPKELVELPTQAVADAWVSRGLCILREDLPDPIIKIHPVEKPAPKDDKVISAMTKMDPEKDFDASGKPRPEVLSKALKGTVTINQRDRCFDEFMQLQRTKHLRASEEDEGEIVE